MNATEILEKLVTGEMQLANALLATKIIAKRSNQLELEDWITKESTGYQKNDDLPDYRVLSTLVQGHISNGYQRQSNAPVPLLHLKEDLQEKFKKAPLGHAISAIEELIQEDKGLMSPIAPEGCMILNHNLEANGYFVEAAWKNITKAQLSGIVETVKQIVVDLLLELEKSIPVDASIDASYSEAVAEAFGKVNQKHGNVVIFGNNNSVELSIGTINIGDKASLENTLASYSIPKEDIDELKEIIESEKPVDDKLGPKTKGWIGKLTEKALSGSVGVGVNVAAVATTKAICAYFGIPIP